MMKFIYGLMAALVLLTGSAVAQDRIMLQVGYSPGGSYDVNARAVAEFLGAHLPGNPEVIVENVPGAGSKTLARTVMEMDNSDGSHIAMISSALALAPIFDPTDGSFDPTRVHYIATLSHAASYCIAHKDSGIETFDQFLASPDAKAGATGRSSTTYTYPAAIKNALGGQFQIVTGFKGGNEIDLAMERGDIQVRCGIGLNTLSKGDMLERYNVLAELALQPNGELDGPAFALDYAPDEDTRAALALVFASGSVHHPIVAAPNTPPETVEMLRAAFAALNADDGFQAANKDRILMMDVTPGAEAEAEINGFLSQPAAVRDRARALVQ